MQGSMIGIVQPNERSHQSHAIVYYIELSQKHFLRIYLRILKSLALQLRDQTISRRRVLRAFDTIRTRTKLSHALMEKLGDAVDGSRKLDPNSHISSVFAHSDSICECASLLGIGKYGNQEREIMHTYTPEARAN